MNANYDQTYIEKTLEDIARRLKISNTIYQGKRPTSVTDKVNDFVVVKVVGSIEDMNAYGSASVSFDLFARDLAGDIKNSKKLSIMYQKLIAGLYGIEGDLIFGELRQLADMSDGAGFSVRMTQGHITIKNKINHGSNIN